RTGGARRGRAAAPHVPGDSVRPARPRRLDPHGPATRTGVRAVRPGSRLRSLARRMCSQSTMDRLIDPVIADLQCEYAQAIRDHRRWRRRWILLRGYLAFWKAVA